MRISDWSSDVCSSDLNLEIWDDEPVQARIDALAEAQAAHLSLLTAHPRATSLRRLGTIAALDVAAPDGGYLSAIAPRLIAFFRDRGVLLSPLGNSVSVMPPYCITPLELTEVWRPEKRRSGNDGARTFKS